MCRLITVGSGSSGNTYLLQCGDEVLVLDCGIPFIEVKKALNFNIRGVVGAIVTHAHGDHAKYIGEYYAAGIPTWMPYVLDDQSGSRMLGGFSVCIFPLVHDVPCVGYLIKHERLGRMLYVTDTSYVRYKFRNLNVILTECNWDEQFVDKTEPKYRHVLTGHMNLQTCIGMIEANKNDNLRQVILCHISDDNGHPEVFRRAIKGVVGEFTDVKVAEPGSVIDLSEIPF